MCGCMRYGVVGKCSATHATIVKTYTWRDPAKISQLCNSISYFLTASKFPSTRICSNIVFVAYCSFCFIPALRRGVFELSPPVRV